MRVEGRFGSNLGAKVGQQFLTARLGWGIWDSMCLLLMWRSRHLGVLPGEEALFEAAVHGERDEGQKPPVLQQPERSQEGLAERLPVPTELAGLLPVNIVQKHRHNEHGQHTHACHTTKGRQR